MVVVVAVRLAVVDVECFVGKWFLEGIISGYRDVKIKEAYVATLTVEAITVIFPFQLAVGGGHCLFLNREITTAALEGKLIKGSRFSRGNTYLGQIHVLPASITKHPATIHGDPPPIVNGLTTARALFRPA